MARCCNCGSLKVDNSLTYYNKRDATNKYAGMRKSVYWCSKCWEQSRVDNERRVKEFDRKNKELYKMLLEQLNSRG